MYKLLSNNSCSLFKAFCKCLGGDHDHDHHDHPKTHDQQTDANSTSEAERQMKITEEENGSLARSPPKPPISSRVGDQINGEEDGSLARSPPKPPISSRVGDQINVNFSVSIGPTTCPLVFILLTLGKGSTIVFGHSVGPSTRCLSALGGPSPLVIVRVLEDATSIVFFGSTTGSAVNPFLKNLNSSF
ncbi:hypothetical protein LWI29_025101 [Acer saccharum]|uniref:Uncharacterized protein n=1 Tax=Acer saccharum TaxID=4024 RepID=A0AA39W8Y0_ACESA|nr:hypothetical protein LWI29_025101 [Acer saccharum]